uniref:Uncharacterized protein n=1 Tax=Bracon brevicornis TaxID=1563983 RepID=A0A6V7HZD9_9HYME
MYSDDEEEPTNSWSEELKKEYEEWRLKVCREEVEFKKEWLRRLRVKKTKLKKPFVVHGWRNGKERSFGEVTSRQVQSKESSSSNRPNCRIRATEQTPQSSKKTDKLSCAGTSLKSCSAGGSGMRVPGKNDKLLSRMKEMEMDVDEIPIQNVNRSEQLKKIEDSRKQTPSQTNKHTTSSTGSNRGEDTNDDNEQRNVSKETRRKSLKVHFSRPEREERVIERMEVEEDLKGSRVSHDASDQDELVPDSDPDTVDTRNAQSHSKFGKISVFDTPNTSSSSSQLNDTVTLQDNDEPLVSKKVFNNSTASIRAIKLPENKKPSSQQKLVINPFAHLKSIFEKTNSKRKRLESDSGYDRGNSSKKAKAQCTKNSKEIEIIYLSD